jgi:hypothetical protein
MKDSIANVFLGNSKFNRFYCNEEKITNKPVSLEQSAVSLEIKAPTDPSDSIDSRKEVKCVC